MPIVRHGYAKRKNKDNAKRAANRKTVVSQASGTICALCNHPLLWHEDIEADHIIPISAGGSDELWNLRAVHRSCNRKRGQG